MKRFADHVGGGVVMLRRDNDRAHLRRAYEKQLEIYQPDSDAAKELLNVGAGARDESLPLAQHAALTAVCLGILNLDEALTRE